MALQAMESVCGKLHASHWAGGDSGNTHSRVNGGGGQLEAAGAVPADKGEAAGEQEEAVMEEDKAVPSSTEAPGRAHEEAGSGGWWLRVTQAWAHADRVTAKGGAQGFGGLMPV